MRFLGLGGLADKMFSRQSIQPCPQFDKNQFDKKGTDQV
jgi:hypothetical protein